MLAVPNNSKYSNLSEIQLFLQLKSQIYYIKFTIFLKNRDNKIFQFIKISN